jgi:hypothetical protein
MHTNVSHHGLSKEDSVEVQDHLTRYQSKPFVYVRLGDVQMYADTWEDFEVLFKQALIQIAKLRLEKAS